MRAVHGIIQGLGQFRYERPIRFSDTDAVGVVYFAQLLSLCHEAYEASLSAAGLDLSLIFKGDPFALPITHVEADFRRPLRMGDRPVVDLSAQLEANSTFSISYQVWLEEGLAATALTRHVCIQSLSRSRAPLPPELCSWLKTVQQEQIFGDALS